MKRIIIIILFFVALKESCICQSFLNNDLISSPLNGHFATDSFGNKGVSFYLTIGNDTFNNLDCFGRKQGKWIEPFFIKSKEKVALNTIISIDAFIEGIEKTNTFDSLNLKKGFLKNFNSSDYISTLVFYSISNKLMIYQDLTCDDNVLYLSTPYYLRKDGLYLESYWFGSLFGKYSNGVRVGKWMFYPKYTNNQINFLDGVEMGRTVIERDTNGDSMIRISKKLIRFEVGDLLNNERIGDWYTYRLINDTISFLGKSKFDKDKLLEIWSYNQSSSSFEKFAMFENIENKKIMTIFYEHSIRKIDISHIPYELRGFGERSYFEWGVFNNNTE